MAEKSSNVLTRFRQRFAKTSNDIELVEVLREILPFTDYKVTYPWMEIKRSLKPLLNVNRVIQRMRSEHL